MQELRKPKLQWNENVLYNSHNPNNPNIYTIKSPVNVLEANIHSRWH